LGVRTALEEGVLQLLGAVEAIPAEPCIEGIPYIIPKESADQLRTHPDAELLAQSTPKPGTVQPAQRTGPLQNTGGAQASQSSFRVVFDYGSTERPGSSLTNMDRVAAMSAKAAVAV
jgi:hypothetical protein